MNDIPSARGPLLPFVDPRNGTPLRTKGDWLTGDGGSRFPIIEGIPRFCEIENYTSSFGQQWNLFERTQIDREGIAGSPSAERLLAETAWDPKSLAGMDILEVGSGAGRFSRAILERTSAKLYSVDYSTAVEANRRNNGAIGGSRFLLAQASIYEMPFPDDSFDKVLCLGVLQHTPDFEQSVAALVSKAKPRGEIVVDFYPIRGFWTKIHAKYLLRPISRRLPPQKLLKAIDRNVDWMIRASDRLDRAKLGVLRRFLPLADIGKTMPAGLSPEQLREWVVLDTFDMFSPRYDNPQPIGKVAQMFERAGADVTFSGFVPLGAGSAAVVRAVKRSAVSSSGSKCR